MRGMGSSPGWVVLAVLLAIGAGACGDDGALADASNGGGDSTIGTDDDDSNDDDSNDERSDDDDGDPDTSSGGSSTTASWDPSTDCIDDPEAGPDCGAPDPDPAHWVAHWVSPGYGWYWTEVDDASCIVYAVAAYDGFVDHHDVGLSCAVEGSSFARSIAMRVRVHATSVMPLRMGQRVVVSTRTSEGPFLALAGSFVIRDAETGDTVLGARDTSFRADELFEPFGFASARDICGQVAQPDLGECVSPLYQGSYGIDVTRDGGTVRVMNGASEVVGDSRVYVTAIEHTWHCGCSDTPNWSESIVFGTGFADAPAPNGVTCDLIAQNCGPDQKCVPTRSDATAWDGTACVAVGAVAIGEPCESDVDCAGASACVANACRSICTGSIDALECPDERWCNLDLDGDVPPMVCIPGCDPLAPDCDEGEVCLHDVPGDDDWPDVWRCAPARADSGAPGASADPRGLPPS